MIFTYHEGAYEIDGHSLFPFLPALLFTAATSTTSFGVSAIVTGPAFVTAAPTTDPRLYQSAKATYVMTDANTGEKVDVYLNGSKIGSAVSQDGVIVIQVSEAIGKARPAKVDLTFKVGSHPVRVLQTAIDTGRNSIPQMKMTRGTRQVTGTNPDGSQWSQLIEVKDVYIEY